jgi:hypothetical protein
VKKFCGHRKKFCGHRKRFRGPEEDLVATDQIFGAREKGSVATEGNEGQSRLSRMPVFGPDQRCALTGARFFPYAGAAADDWRPTPPPRRTKPIATPPQALYPSPIAPAPA